ncbi:PfkB family carbohydrate kinase [Microcella daejeonensis]|uniref:PfkB family carbohydrate kinase n=1 Tax=Microcella daejeonensis TaxID=2994971 RepID=A0A9E8MMU8_9MICO|nr:PfkB family carbohydrate kinase [Microcella daejeonensis]WAB82575.1 PfkB family carbohydrate kinase [Microcella daejeonensis]
MVDARRALVVGDVIDDLIVVPSGPVRPDTDTTARITRSPGGSAANTAAWLAALGAPVDLVARVGAGRRELHAAELAAAGVTAHLSEDAERGTGTIVIIVEGDRRAMLTDRGANATLDPAEVTDALLDAAGALHLTGYSLFDALDPAALHDLVARARHRGVAVLFDPGSAGFIADYGVARFTAAVRGVDLLLPNLDEGRLLAGLDERSEAPAVAEALLDLAPAVMLTCGAVGVVIAEREGGIRSMDARPVITVDPTGAGDAFTAGVIAARLRGADLDAAALAGMAAAATAVGRVGGRPSRQ